MNWRLSISFTSFTWILFMILAISFKSINNWYQPSPINQTTILALMAFGDITRSKRLFLRSTLRLDQHFSSFSRIPLFARCNSCMIQMVLLISLKDCYVVMIIALSDHESTQGWFEGVRNRQVSVDYAGLVRSHLFSTGLTAEWVCLFKDIDSVFPFQPCRNKSIIITLISLKPPVRRLFYSRHFYKFRKFII